MFHIDEPGKIFNGLFLMQLLNYWLLWNKCVSIFIVNNFQLEFYVFSDISFYFPLG